MALSEKAEGFADVGEDKKTGHYYEGREIIASKVRGRPITWVRNPTFHAPETKIDAATLYAVYGDVTQVSELTNVPEKTIREWKDEPWWIEIQKKVYCEQNENLSSRISKVLDTTITQLEDRLEHGDHCIVQKTGEVIIKPVDASVLAKMFENLAHQRRITRGEPTSITAKVNTDDRLKHLEAAFIRFTTAKEITQEETLIALEP